MPRRSSVTGPNSLPFVSEGLKALLHAWQVCESATKHASHVFKAVGGRFKRLPRKKWFRGLLWALTPISSDLVSNGEHELDPATFLTPADLAPAAAGPPPPTPWTAQPSSVNAALTPWLAQSMPAQVPNAARPPLHPSVAAYPMTMPAQDPYAARPPIAAMPAQAFAAPPPWSLSGAPCWNPATMPAHDPYAARPQLAEMPAIRPPLYPPAAYE